MDKLQHHVCHLLFNRGPWPAAYEKIEKPHEYCKCELWVCVRSLLLLLPLFIFILLLFFPFCGSHSHNFIYGRKLTVHYINKLLAPDHDAEMVICTMYIYIFLRPFHMLLIYLVFFLFFALTSAAIDIYIFFFFRMRWATNENTTHGKCLCNTIWHESCWDIRYAIHTHLWMEVKKIW